MKTLLKLLTLSFAILATLSFGPKEVRAETVLIYDFSQYDIPEGQPEKLEVDSTSIELMRQNPTFIGGFVDSLSRKYNTTYAIINKPIEITYLTGVVNGTSLAGVHIPSYTSALSNQLVTTNTGETYIDVNITTQSLTVFINGTATMVTPVVTGNINKSNGTPTGNFNVVYKQRNRTLVGPNNSYRSFVKYWMRITKNGAIGIHDASWRSNFGGEIYKSNGSHGCINVPSVVMPTIYESIPEGTPVYVHY